MKRLFGKRLRLIGRYEEIETARLAMAAYERNLPVFVSPDAFADRDALVLVHVGCQDFNNGLTKNRQDFAKHSLSFGGKDVITP